MSDVKPLIPPGGEELRGRSKWITYLLSFHFQLFFKSLTYLLSPFWAFLDDDTMEGLLVITN